MSTRLFLSSGDLVADRRFDFARDLQLRGDLEAALDLLQQAVELAPRFASAWFTMGDIHEKLGQREQAVTAYQEAKKADPEDRHGALPRLMRLGVAEISALPPAYVRSLFDQYAPRFDSSLVGDLGYCGPALLFKAVLAVRTEAGRPALFRRAIDLGCGTGLAASAFAGQVDEFIGIDLSPGMIKQARITGLYAELEVADMVEGLQRQPDGTADLVLAADAMVYLNDLGPVLCETHRVLQPGGLMAFTLETHEGDGIVMGPGLRYSHSLSYVRSRLAAAGLRLCQIQPSSTRHENGMPVPSLVVVGEK